MRKDLVIDPWTPLDYKQVFGDASAHGGPTNAPWLSRQDRRRLSAYLVLAAYAENSARWLFNSDDEDADAERREYGDASLVIESALTALMGDSQRISIPEADDFDPDLPADKDQRSAEERAEAVEAYAMLERLRDWWDAENLDLTLLDGERKAVTLGDSVYILTWDAVKVRPRVTVVDPGFYFPVLPTGLVSEPYPDRVHFLWETPPEEHPDGKGRVTRLTYEMGPIRPLPAPTFLGVEVGEPTLQDGDRWEGAPFASDIVRDLPWSEEPVRTTCYLTEATWVVTDLGRVDGRTSAGVDGMTLDKATFAVRPGPDGQMALVRDLDLRLDFLPIVHVPNTVPGEAHFGQAVLTKSAQILDDLQSADTDSNAAAATTGSPMLALSNATVPYVTDPVTRKPMPETQSIGPGKVWQMGADGHLDSIDTSAQLAEMRNYVNDLQRRFTRNARVPDVAIGIVDSGVSDMSGIALQLRYGPLEALVRGMRLVRKAKHPILLKFAQRMLMLDPEWDGPTRTFPADIMYGSFMPQDLAGAIKRATEAYAAGIISLETAVMILQQAGMPIEDALAEVEKIERRDYEKAGQLMDAINDAAAAREFLHLEPAPAAPPIPLVPPAVPGPAAGGLPATITAPTTPAEEQA